MLLSVLDKETKAKTLLLLWCACHLRNDIMHGKGLATVQGSSDFLTSYAISLNSTGQAVAGALSDKGKRIVLETVIARKCMKETGARSEKPWPRWTMPPEGWVNLNTDAGFRPDIVEASTGKRESRKGSPLSMEIIDTRRVCRRREAEASLDGIRLTA
jgi:hypothetical protein